MTTFPSLANEIILAGEGNADEDKADEGGDDTLFPVSENRPKRLVDLDAMVRKYGGSLGLSPLPHPDLVESDLPRWDDYRLLVLRMIVGRRTDKQIQGQCQLQGVPIPDEDTLRSYRLDRRVRDWMDFDEVAAAYQGMASHVVRVNTLAERAEQLEKLVRLLDPLNEPTKRTDKDIELLSKFLARKQKETEESEKTKKSGRPAQGVDDPYITYSRELRATLAQLDTMQGNRHRGKLLELQIKDQREQNKMAEKAVNSGRGVVVILPSKNADPWDEDIPALESVAEVVE